MFQPVFVVVVVILVKLFFVQTVVENVLPNIIDEKLNLSKSSWKIL